MLNKIFLLGALFCSIAVFAQDNLEQMFRADNPNLMNLNESKPYTGSPLIYIEGVTPPEKATNDMESLQLKFFGTKNVQEATKNTLQLSPNELPQFPENQIQNFTFQTPFHQTTRAGFIPHIPAFYTLIQILNQQYIRVTESITVMNTEENKFWTRLISLPDGAKAQLLSYTQNGSNFPQPSQTRTKTLEFNSPKSLELGPNQLSLTYQIENPFSANMLTMNLMDSQIAWPTEDFRVAILFPTEQNILTSKLVFGNNYLDIPDIYTQQVDSHSNLNFLLNRIIPAHASVHLQLQLDPAKLSPATSDSTGYIVALAGLGLLFFYWFVFAWWEKRKVQRQNLRKIHYPHMLLYLAHQMGVELTEMKWQQLIEFGQQNHWPISKLQAEQNLWQNQPQKAKKDAALHTLIYLATEPFIGSCILTLGILIAYSYATEKYPFLLAVLLILLCLIGVYGLYCIALRPIRKLYWRQKLTQLLKPAILAGVTAQQVRQIYPLFILVHKQEEWRQALIKMNPKIAQEVHLCNNQIEQQKG